MKYVLSIAVGLIVAIASIGAFADSYSVDGKTFESKAMAIRYVINSGKRLEVQETRCLILTNKLSLKACPKNKAQSFETQQFESISKTN